jgi:antitoxin ParD1/3/4
MTITLPPDLEIALSDRVANGSYDSEADVIREALRLLDDRELRLDVLRAKVAEGVADAEAGRVSMLSAEDIKRMARERFMG